MEPNTSPPALWPRVALAIGLLLAAGVLLALWPALSALSGAFTAAIAEHRFLVGLALLLSIGAAIAAGLRMLFAVSFGMDGRARQQRVVRLQNDLPISVDDVHAAFEQLAASSLAQFYAAKLAEAERLTPLLTSQNQHFHIEHAPSAAGQTDAEVAPIALSSESEWLGWTDLAPHLMVAGRTESGKTTTVEAILARRILAGDLVLVVDPHYQTGKWLGATAIGGGRNYAACYETFDAVRALLDLRYKAFDAGRRTEDFRRITIVVDEVPAIIAHAQMQSKALFERWVLFATSLGSEARKVRISIILLTQSPLVRDIYISSAMRENFTRIALGDTAADLLREEPTPARKQALLELLRGRPYPAAMEYRNNWYALQNDGIRDLARANGLVPRAPTSLITPVQRAITGSLPPAASPSAPAQISPTERVRMQQERPTVQMMITNPEQILDLLAARSDWLTASEIAAALRIDEKVTRTEIKKLVDSGQVRRRACKGRTTKETYEYQSTNQPVNRSTALSA